MANAQTSELFLDTSIQIARWVHGPQTKAAIKLRLSKHTKHITSLVVRQEFKRRLLKEAQYLLALLDRYRSFDEVHQHVIRLFGPWHQRKRTICLQTLAIVHEVSDAERTERLRLYLRSLLVTGMRRFDQSVDEVRRESGCAWGIHEVVEKKGLNKYELGNDKCSRAKTGACGIRQFLADRTEIARKLLQYFQALPPARKSAEIQKSEAFLATTLRDPHRANFEDPCLTVGDLLIAIESVGISNFLTLNSAESQHLCRALGQTLIVHPVDPTKSEIVCQSQDASWPEFGKRS